MLLDRAQTDAEIGGYRLLSIAIDPVAPQYLCSPLRQPGHGPGDDTKFLPGSQFLLDGWAIVDFLLGTELRFGPKTLPAGAVRGGASTVEQQIGRHLVEVGPGLRDRARVQRSNLQVKILQDVFRLVRGSTARRQEAEQLRPIFQDCRLQAARSDVGRVIDDVGSRESTMWSHLPGT